MTAGFYTPNVKFGCSNTRENKYKHITFCVLIYTKEFHVQSSLACWLVTTDKEDVYSQLYLHQGPGILCCCQGLRSHSPNMICAALEEVGTLLSGFQLLVCLLNRMFWMGWSLFLCVYTRQVSRVIKKMYTCRLWSGYRCKAQPSGAVFM